MKPLITQIEIKNFRSFGNRTGETTKVMKLNNINIISGANDSGKSNILRALNLFFNGRTSLVDFFDFEQDFFKKKNKDKKDIKEELVTVKIWFRNDKNTGKNMSSNRIHLPEEFWVSKKWKKTSRYSQYDQKSNIDLNFTKEKSNLISSFIDEKGDLKSTTKASLQKLLTEFLNSIQFHYVPAIKDQSYFSHLYGELQQTLWKAEESSVAKKKNEFESEIQNETLRLMTEFKETLNHPSLNFDPAFQLPQDMTNLFKTMHVNTGNVELKFRGDGVQAKLIPEILNFIALKEKELTNKTVRRGERPKKYFIWGFEEPENSYEYKNAQLLADRFKEKFIENAQIFITTHSFNFISMKSEKVSKYRVWKDDKILSSRISKLTETRNGELLLDGFENGCDEVLDELGFFKLNEKIMDAYNEIQKELNRERKNNESLNDKINQLNPKMILYVEGITDKIILETAWNKLNFNKQMPFLIEPRDGHKNVKTALDINSCYILHPKIIYVGLFDFDDAFNSWNGLNKENWDKINCNVTLLKKHKKNNAFAMILPIPEFRTNQADENFANSSILSLELLFTDEVLGTNISPIKSRPNPDSRIKDFIGDKTKFANKTKLFEKTAFSEFEKIFDIIDKILNGL